MLTLVCLLFAVSPAYAFASSNQAVFMVGSNNFFLNEVNLEMDAVPFISADRTFVPVRYLAKSIDVPIYWNNEKQRVELPLMGSEDGTRFILYAGDSNLYIESAYGKESLPKLFKSMDVAPINKNDRIYLPARYIAELYDYEVGWDDETQSVLIGLPGKLPSPNEGKLTPYSISSHKITLNNQSMKIDMKIPQINGLQDTLLQEQLNSQMINKALVLQESIEGLYQDSPEYGPYELISDYEAYATKDLLTIGVQNYQYTGGAHGGANMEYYNIDNKNNRILELKDLFIDGVNYKEIINQYIKKQIDLSIQNGEYKYFDEFTSISDNQSFYIKDQSIIICFSQYEIAPYSSGMPEFELPLELIKWGLNESIFNTVK